MSATDGYYRTPAVHGDRIVFAAEDDLWEVPAAGGVARRLTSNPGRESHPTFSPDGRWLAFTGRDEGHSEVYIMPAEGGQARRLTFLGAETRVVCWRPGGEGIVFATSHGQPFLRAMVLMSIGPGGGDLTLLPTGPAMSISYGPSGGAVIGRHTTDLARWKRYRGGLTGELWVDGAGTGDWRRLIKLDGNVAVPLWIGDRIYFLSDHEGVGNLYSCAPGGDDLQRHTDHDWYYARHPSTDGRRITYHSGADIYLFDPVTGETGKVPVAFHSSRPERQRRFVDAQRFLQSYDPHPAGHSVAVTTRGQLFTMANWEGAPVHHSHTPGVRHRLATWLGNGERLLVVSDASGEDRLEVRSVDGQTEPTVLDADVGRPVRIAASPSSNHVALSNHRYELQVVDLDSGEARLIDRSRFGRIRGFAWSPDSRWLAYGLPNTRQTCAIRIANVSTGETFPVTEPVLQDVSPAFDPEGKYLYFLSIRDFNPVYDNLHFELGFPWGSRPHLVTLRADLPNPFEPVPRSPGERPPTGAAPEDPEPANVDGAAGDEEGDGSEPDPEPAPAEQHGDPDGPNPMVIDLDGLAQRVTAFPVPEGRYGQIRGIKGKALFTWLPLQGALDAPRSQVAPPPANGHLHAWDFASQKKEELASGITNFEVSQGGTAVYIRAGNRLRALKAGVKAPTKGQGAGRESGWLHLGRVRVSVQPTAEWRQMLHEAWRLQRDQFWVPDMSGVDWHEVLRRYEPLIDRLGTRSELSDLLWEMQGELGTSHAYEFGGDYRPEPEYMQGLLGADLRYNPDVDGYEVTSVVVGDRWHEEASSPLARVGGRVEVGEHIVAVNGQRLSRTVGPGELLVNQSKQRVSLTVRGAEGAERVVTVKTLATEMPARYRDWVVANRQHVHDASGGRVGYIHIPDMGPRGYAEFHRGFLPEVDREGLIVDVRFNGGGHVSQLILEKLARRRLGYDIQRWGEPVPYPFEAVQGPLVAVTNEAAGSDGDMFSHAFKVMGLGPLIGKRTWGGVIGISVRDSLVDGGVTTQPEFSFWFEGVGYGLENYGADPDIEVDIRPQDAVAGEDPQLDKAVGVILGLIEASPPVLPDFGERPSRELPRVSR